MKKYRIIGNEGRVTIPFVLRDGVGFRPGDVVSFEMTAPDTVVVKREKIQGCDCSREELPSLRELLDGLSEEEQKAALVYLSHKRSVS